MRSRLYSYLLLAIIIMLISCKRNEHRPNIVFIFPDQHRRASVGFMNEDPVITPNLDRLAEGAVVFKNASSTIPVCSPFRAMLMTGNYYTVNNVPQNCNSNHRGIFLRTDEYTILDALNNGGYDVAYIGKWHLEEPKAPYVKSGNNGGPGRNNWEEWTPPERRHGVKFWYAYNTFDNHFKPHYWSNESTRDNRIEVREWSPIHETSKAIDFVRNEEGKYRDPDKPFAVFLSYNPPHTGYAYVPDEYKKLYEGKSFDELNNRESLREGSGGERHAKMVLSSYFACVSGIDDQVGRMVKFLKDEGLFDNTIFIFTSDHGNCLGAHNHITKTIFYEEAFGIPLIISWPEKLQHRITDMLFSPTDFFPTIAGLAGLDIPDTHGRDLSEKVLTDTGYEHDGALYANLPYFDTDSLIGGYPGKAWGERGVRTKDYMLVVNKMPGTATGYHLTDLNEDPYQLSNIALQNRHIVDAMIEDILNPGLKAIEDDWWKIPLSKQSEYPANIRALEDNAAIWDWGL